VGVPYQPMPNTWTQTCFYVFGLLGAPHHLSSTRLSLCHSLSMSLSHWVFLFYFISHVAFHLVGHSHAWRAPLGTAPSYAEPLYAFLTFTGIAAWQAGWNLLAAAPFALAAATRSNGLLNAGFFLYGALIQRRHLVSSLLGAAAVVCTFQWVVAHPKRWLCQPPVRTYCQPGSVSAYAFVQDRYWNVGLFRYWSPANLGNFVLALPMLLHAIACAAVNLLAAWKLQPRTRPWWLRSVAALARGAPSEPSPVHAVQTLAYVALAVAWMHVQVSLRVFSCLHLLFAIPAESTLKWAGVAATVAHVQCALVVCWSGALWGVFAASVTKRAMEWRTRTHTHTHTHTNTHTLSRSLTHSRTRSLSRFLCKLPLRDARADAPKSTSVQGRTN
jgi:hypothetical protein